MIFKGSPNCLIKLQELESIKQEKQKQIAMLKEKAHLIESCLKEK